MPVCPRKRLEMAIRRERVSALCLAGWTEVRIAAELGVTRQTVAADVRAIQRGYEARTDRNEKARREQLVAELEVAKQEAWVAYRAGQKETRRTRARKVRGLVRVVKVRVGGKNGGEKTEIVKLPDREETSVEQRPGVFEAAFLGKVIDAVMGQAKIEGLIKEPTPGGGGDSPAVKIYVGDGGWQDAV
jgi:hypothetical protein